jgi:hypothetical protein
MSLRKLATIGSAIAALALAAPVAGASAQTGGPTGMIPCYPYPAFCGPNGQPFNPFFPFSLTPLTQPTFGPGPVQLPTPSFGPGPVQLGQR